jgi:hypothetical protein
MPTPRPRGIVHIWSRGARKPGRVTDCLATDMTVRYHDDNHGLPLADYYVVDKLDLATEREAMRVRAIPVVLPEAKDWLSMKVREKVDAGTDVVIAMRRQP